MNLNFGERTEVLYGIEDTTKALLSFYSKVNNRCDGYGVSSSLSPWPLKTKSKKISVILRRLKDKGVKTRYISEITRDNVKYCKRLMEIVDLRHSEGVRANMYVSDAEFIASPTPKDAEAGVHIIYSNEDAMVQQNQYLFDAMWNQAVPARQRIRELEKGIEREFFEVFTDRQRVSQILLDLAKSVKKEALLILPNDRALVRVDKLGVVDYIIKAAQNGAIVKIICPLSEDNSKVVKRITEEAPDIAILNGNNSLYGMYIADGEKLLRAELREPRAEKFSDAIGFAIYSNSRRNADSFRSIFELLWRERALNEQLKLHEKMQKEFINIAAHELRLPIQPLLVSSQELKEMMPEDELVSIVIKNARRLQSLANNILDLSRIESNTLNLKKEKLNLNELTTNVIRDLRRQISNNRKMNVLFEESGNNKEMFVEADRERLVQVFSNLLNNALAFTKEGSISIAIKSGKGHQSHEVIIAVKDTGIGIQPEILPRLFQKFATNSETGTGLGLFISKNIVEAHGGNIWVENNSDSKGGATFCFSLPMAPRLDV